MYHNVNPRLFFGNTTVILHANTSVINAPQPVWLLGHPEKALLDLLYLFSFYDNEEEPEQLRLDEDYMTWELNIVRLSEYQQVDVDRCNKLPSTIRYQCGDTRQDK